jgi:hypothetical protein
MSVDAHEPVHDSVLDRDLQPFGSCERVHFSREQSAKIVVHRLATGFNQATRSKKWSAKSDVVSNWVNRAFLALSKPKKAHAAQRW